MVEPLLTDLELCTECRTIPTPLSSHNCIDILGISRRTSPVAQGERKCNSQARSVVLKALYSNQLQPQPADLQDVRASARAEVLMCWWG